MTNTVRLGAPAPGNALARPGQTQRENAMLRPSIRRLVLALALSAGSAVRAQTLADVAQQAADYNALIRAETAKSALCRSFVGKVVAPANVDSLAARLAGAGEKREFETTAQYQARVAASSAGTLTGPVIVPVTLDRDHVHYDADLRGVTVAAAAFPTGAFSADSQADVAAGLAAFKFEKDATRRNLHVPLFQTARVLEKRLGRNGFGVTMRVEEAERHTRGLDLSSERLFGFASDEQSTVTGFDLAPALARRIKASVRGALVVQPEAPFVVKATLDGAAATAQSPVHYTERSTILIASPRCALILDGQSRVLASADTATAASRPDDK